MSHSRLGVRLVGADQDPVARGEGVFAAARADRARLEFLLELGHELRTPAGVIAGYLALARQGEISLEEAVHVAGVKANDLCALLDGLMVMARERLGRRETWRERVAMAHSESERLHARTEAATAAARALLDRLDSAGSTSASRVRPKFRAGSNSARDRGLPGM